MKRLTPFLALLILGAAAAAEPSAGRPAEVELLSPKAAFERLSAAGTYLVDVRSVAEYVLIGHPPMAWNVPITFWSETDAAFAPNPDFIKDLKARFKPEDALIFICRSGGRSLRAAQTALEAGFAKAASVQEGFEGSVGASGLRTEGGWKNVGLPVTYALEPPRAYAPAK